MILLFLFLSYWLGLSFKYCWYIYLILIIGLFILLFKRYTKKLAFICLSTFLVGVGVSFIKFSFNKQIYEGMVYEVKDNYFLFNSSGEKLYVYEKNTNHEVGDILKISGEKNELDFTMLESSFDFEEYLNLRGVYKELKYSKIETKFATFLKLNKVKKQFLNHFDEDTKALISSILFSSGDDSSLTDLIRDFHLSKLLSANGTYIHLFISIIVWLLSKLFKEKWARLGGLGISSIYLIFLFPKFSIIRITFIFLLRWLNDYVFKEKLAYIPLICLSGLFFLIINPHLALQTSFVLGYSIPIAFYLTREACKERKKITKKLMPLLLMYIFCIPFELSFNNSICPFSFILAILFAPIFILIELAGILCLFKIPIYGVVKFLGDIVKNILLFIKPINIEIYSSKFNPIILFIYYVIFFLFIYFYKIRFKPVNKMISLTYLCLMFSYFIPLNNRITNEVTFINVGQGDSCLIRNKNKTILIDTGGLTYYDITNDTLIPFFKKKKIYKLDLVITTHDDFDHSGALVDLQNNFLVKKYVNNSGTFPIKIGDVVIENYNNHIGEQDDENFSSLVLGFKLLNKNFLVTGDAPIEIEKYIMKEYQKIDCDILKVGHHGSDTSTCKEFIKFLSPKEAIISVGKNNRYGHPSDKVISYLKSAGVVVKRTDINGSITYKDFIFNE